MPSAVAWPLRSLSIAEEAAGAANFAVDQFGTPANFLDIPAQPDSLTWTPERPFQDPNELQQLKHGRSTKVHGVPRATLSYAVPLARTGIVNSPSVANGTAASSALLRQLKIAFGGLRGGNQASLVASGSSATGFTVTTAQGTRFTAGGAIGWVNALGVMEIRGIKSVTGDAIVLKHALSGAPAVGNTIFNAVTAYLDDGGAHAQFRAVGKHTADAWSIRGAQLSSIGFTLASGAIPMLNFQWQAALWENRGPVTLAPAVYSNHRKFSFNNGEFQAQVVGVNTRSVPCVREFTVNSGLTYVPQTCVAGVNTIEEYVQQHTPGVFTGSFRQYYNGQTWFGIWDAATSYMLALTMVDGSAGGIMLEFPNVQIGPVTAPQNANGLGDSSISWEAGLDTDATDQSSAIRTSAGRVHIIN